MPRRSRKPCKDAAANLSRLLKTELEWIPLKAMRKERKERYDTPADLARDVQNYLEGRPLVAAPESTAYRVRKYIRRNRGFVIGATTVLAALVLGLGLATWQWAEANRARDAAVAQGIVINGLPILAFEPFLDQHYEQEVIGGEGSFMIVAKNFETFGDAVLRKLIAEIADLR